jgi:hypothetical protein
VVQFGFTTDVFNAMVRGDAVLSTGARHRRESGTNRSGSEVQRARGRAGQQEPGGILERGPGHHRWVRRRHAGPICFTVSGVILEATLKAHTLQGAISAAHLFVVFISKNSVGYSYVNQEIGFALRAEKPVVPLVMPGASHDELGMLAGHEYIRFDPERPEEALAALSEELQRVTPLANRSLIRSSSEYCSC